MKRSPSSQRGAAAVEFALLSGLLLIFLFGIVEFGFLWMSSNYTANAAREGARVYAKSTGTSTEKETKARTAVENYLDSLFLFKSHIDDPGFLSVTYQEVTLTATTATETIDIPMAKVTVTVATGQVWAPVLWPLMEALLSGLPFFGSTDFPDDYLTSMSQSATYTIEN